MVGQEFKSWVSGWAKKLFYERASFVKASNGATSGGRPLVLNSSGKLDSSFFGVFQVTDANFTLVDDADATKKFMLQLSSITTGTTRTWTVPNSSDTFVGKATTDILTNKTLTTPTISATGFTNAQHAHTGATSGGQLDHTAALTNVGTNTHAQIDTALAAAVTFATASSVTTLSGLGGGSAALVNVSAPSSITTSQTWTIDIKCATVGNREGGVVDIWLYGLASGTSSATVHLMYKATVTWYRNVAGDNGVLTINEQVSNVVGVTLTGPTAIADGFRYTVAPTGGTLNRVGYNIIGTGTGINIAANTVA